MFSQVSVCPQGVLLLTVPRSLVSVPWYFPGGTPASGAMSLPGRGYPASGLMFLQGGTLASGPRSLLGTLGVLFSLARIGVTFSQDRVPPPRIGIPTQDKVPPGQDRGTFTGSMSLAFKQEDFLVVWYRMILFKRRIPKNFHLIWPE